MASTSTNQNGRPRKRRNLAVVIIATFFKVVGTLILITLITGVFLACYAATYIKTVIIPQAHQEADFVMNETSTIYYMDPATGQYVEHLSLHGTENRILVSFDEIPEDLINATVAIEDETYWEHKGVNWRRTLYGVFLMFTGRDIQGGSTITQQFIKNFTGNDDVTVKRKILEIFSALDFNETYSKEQVLEWYLNYIYLGDNCYGVASAAKNYFNKDIGDLTLAECASIISITNNPSVYGPYSTIQITNPDTGVVTTGRERNKKRQELVLWKMWDLGIITEEEYRAAAAEELAFTRREDEEKPTTLYNWYDEQLITDVMNDLKEKYGYSDLMASDLVTSGGLKIYACVDQNIQALVEGIYSDASNMEIPSKSGQDLRSAIVIVDREGNITALAGALGEKDRNRGWNYASTSTRQPGSSIKMLSAYAPALEMGLITPASVFDDYPTRVLGGSAWPSNSYGYYKGLSDVRWAVQQSSNAVAVRVLEQVTPELSYDFLTNRFHLTTLEPGREVRGDWKTDIDVSPLALGGLTDGVTVLEMAAAYSVFPRDGIYLAPRTYTKVTREVDGQEIVLLDNTNREGEAVLKTTTTWYVNSMLKNVVASGTGTQAQIPGMTVAGKTGSTNSYQDRWFAGYTPYYTAVVWTGYDRSERIPVSGSYNPAAVLWQMVMSRIHEGLEDRDFTQPEGLITIQYCKDSGQLPTEACALDPRGSRVGSAYVFQGDGPVGKCELHTEVELCTGSPINDANGNPVEGVYHLAGEFCPREPIEALGIEPTIQNVALLALEREQVGNARARDSGYLLSFQEEQGPCDVHTEEIVVPEIYDPNTFEPSDPTTWPPIDDERYLDFDPENPATWPRIPPEYMPPVDPMDPGSIVTPPEGPVVPPTPTPGPDPTSSPEPTGPEEPAIPVEGDIPSNE